jgi:quercetin dioxygenase-like cupin family protein
MLYALASELRASMDFLFGVIPSGELTMTAHGGGRARDAAGPDGQAAGWPEGHGIVQRAAGRRTIDLASGVRWERLTPGADDRMDFLEVVYAPGSGAAAARQALRHDGYEYGLIVRGTLRAQVGFETCELSEGDSIAFDSAIPHEYWNPTPAEVRAVWAVLHARPGPAQPAQPG